MAESYFPHPYVIGYGSSPSRCEPGLFVATGQAWDLPVPAQRACAHARFFDHAGPSGHSRCRARTYCLPPSQRRRRPGYESLRGSMAGLCTPLPTLRRRPYGLRRTAWGRYGSLLLHRIGLAPTARCRSPGALRKIPYLIRQAKAASDRQISKRSNQRLLERRMHSFGTVWWSSCLRFKHCTMVPNSSCRHLADFDDDTLAKTWLHDVNTTPMKFSKRTPNHLSGCPFRPVTPKKVV